MIWLNLSRLNFIYVIVQLILFCIAGSSYISTSYILVMLIFYGLILSIESSFFMYFYLKVRQMESIWDTSSINKVKPCTKTWTKAQVRQLRVGDLILLKRNTVSPADILVIDTSDSHFSDQILYTNERRVTGCNRMTTKRAVKNLRDKNVSKTDSEALKIILPTLDGNLEYEGPSDRVQNFTGTFKLNNDPQVSRISHRNILFCGTQLHTEWIIGIVLFTGQQTKIVQMNMVKWTRFERFQKEIKIARASLVINYLMLTMMCVSVVFTCLALLTEHMRRGLVQETEFINRFMAPGSYKIVNVAMIFQNVSLFVPQMMVIVYEVACFVVGMQIQSKTDKTEAPVNDTMDRVSNGKDVFLGRSSNRKRSSKVSNETLISSENSKRLSIDRGNRLLTGGRYKRGSQLTLNKDPNAHQNASTVVFPKADQKKLNSSHNIGSTDKTPSKSNMMKVINYESLPSLGNISHVVFDKTDTLTMSTMHVCQISTSDRIYNVESESRLNDLMQLYLDNPQEFEFQEDLEENKAKENSYYSEKSQE